MSNIKFHISKMNQTKRQPKSNRHVSACVTKSGRLMYHIFPKLTFQYKDKFLPASILQYCKIDTMGTNTSPVSVFSDKRSPVFPVIMTFDPLHSTGFQMRSQWLIFPPETLAGCCWCK